MRRRSLSVLCAAGLLGSCASPSRQPAAPAALLIAVDRSGAPDPDLLRQLRESCIAAEKELRPGDLYAVLAFDTTTDYVVPFSKAPCSVGEIRGSPGLPNFETALIEIRRGLRSCDALRKQVIILSTGESTSDPAEELLWALRSDGVTVSSICWSSAKFDAVLMSRIATTGGGRFKFTNAPQNLSKLAAMETRASLRD